jgi:hypothetical protein
MRRGSPAFVRASATLKGGVTGAMRVAQADAYQLEEIVEL